ncbi:MAG: ComF family protein [Clostridia bacterium]|nr:ComF family protein [Clostridia bacterium]
MGLLDTIKEKVAEAAYPRRCPLCGALINSNERICSRCSKDVEFIRRPICRICGRPLYTCACRRGENAFVRNVSPLVYTKAAKKGIHRMKFNDSPYSCTYFGKLMANSVRTEYFDCGVRFDCVVYVPMHRDDFRSRGYNQAMLLARTVADEIEVPLLSKALVKNFRNRPQHTLSFMERKRNVQGAFSVPRPELVKGKTLLLCDDVTTSGTTLNECAVTLLDAGAKAVYCVTAAVAVMSEMPAIKAAAFGAGY